MPSWFSDVTLKSDVIRLVPRADAIWPRNGHASPVIFQENELGRLGQQSHATHDGTDRIAMMIVVVRDIAGGGADRGVSHDLAQARLVDVRLRLHAPEGVAQRVGRTRRDARLDAPSNQALAEDVLFPRLPVSVQEQERQRRVDREPPLHDLQSRRAVDSGTCWLGW